jgi:hypothetical protein
MTSSLGKMPTTSVRRLISPFSRSIGFVLWSLVVLFRESHVGEYVGLGTVEDGGELGHLRSDLVGNGAPLQAGGLWRLLGEGGGDEGQDDAATAFAGIRQHVSHEVDAGAFEQVAVPRFFGPVDGLPEAAMLGQKERNQLELFMCGSLRALLPDDHILVSVDRVLDRS